MVDRLQIFSQLIILLLALWRGICVFVLFGVGIWEVFVFV